MKYWAYENWRANGHQVRVHRAACSSCNDGRGLAGGTRADNGKWHFLGELTSMGEAVAKARSNLASTLPRVCGRCGRG